MWVCELGGNWLIEIPTEPESVLVKIRESKNPSRNKNKNKKTAKKPMRIEN